jgi:hypothetical protein
MALVPAVEPEVRKSGGHKIVRLSDRGGCGCHLIRLRTRRLGSERQVTQSPVAHIGFWSRATKLGAEQARFPADSDKCAA